MSVRYETAPLLTLIFVALSLVGGTAKAESVYTDVASCRAQDLGPDEFVRHCKGPKGYAASLHYFDGRAVPAFGKSRPGTKDEPYLESADLEPIEIGVGVPFGKKIEWVMRGGEPCAAILRVDTRQGERLVVSALDGASSRVGMARKNVEARQMASTACKRRVAAQPGGREPVVPTESAIKPTGLPRVGDVLPICSKCPGPLITEVSAGRTITVVARIARPQAKEHCSAWYVDNPEGEADCVEGVLRDYGESRFTAAAMCSEQSIVTEGVKYRYDGPGLDEFGDRTPQWLDLNTGTRAELSSAGARRTVSAQFETLCPGMLAGMGF
ncbi:hypothetical protein Sa4125_15390 [Aureimonas sp. SA4125]|uniref:hypothetical protein n=1 Tax=Aureimonas sp. SA4125 TaxID=2826993 RepID=UPI001CC34DB1|nr:hypothetical protein [Aureimonas sp. SA4125]BDA83997.1 hypothetical protein Sa4125_15390 [Aureimonas sp. SA4125]